MSQSENTPSPKTRDVIAPRHRRRFSPLLSTRLASVVNRANVLSYDEGECLGHYESLCWNHRELRLMFIFVKLLHYLL